MPKEPDAESPHVVTPRQSQAFDTRARGQQRRWRRESSGTELSRTAGPRALVLSKSVPSEPSLDQRFGPSGTRVGSEFQVNTYTTDFQAGPSMAMTAGGEVIIVWTSQGSGHTDSSSWSIQGQRLAADDSPLGGEFQVNSYTTGLQSSASVALAPGGDFVVAWTSRGSVGNDTSQYSI